jgi:hypothetical protein
LELEVEAANESKPETAASLMLDPVMRTQEATDIGVLRCDESLQIDEILG